MSNGLDSEHSPLGTSVETLAIRLMVLIGIGLLLTMQDSLVDFDLWGYGNPISLGDHALNFALNVIPVLLSSLGVAIAALGLIWRPRRHLPDAQGDGASTDQSSYEARLAARRRKMFMISSWLIAIPAGIWVFVTFARTLYYAVWSLVS